MAIMRLARAIMMLMHHALKFLRLAVNKARLESSARIDLKNQIEPAGRRHVAVQRGDDRVDESLEIYVRSELPGEGLDDRMLDGMPYTRRSNVYST
ncbi:hypothetical protein [Bradyrhizobium sp. CCBAU 51753]|uniref:hypothetical protein n=1 Tax=Bradyrhizobium sp. CCBAU 51753 TaxID=1325100 RepID=UPI00188C6F06|nr:hypothetical protein [Bradyrhizobium sp. CCBAU 51753]QOZ24090.1 hypothetical protein XH93_11265 [Bradyrhizobium sp. CCBAU 51753]